ncbi:hypothetical protein [Caulobacter endophyticus]|uniref:hypothetical protein n=1 Tax=Caulobacter endophyticus TaxID=2172652 RepID=UPI002410A4B8|nr:hypothetical protein [Caulobacter endophyticus]MDG2531323.1 hypothetical protein [Caulobacter endophyticus]
MPLDQALLVEDTTDADANIRMTGISSALSSDVVSPMATGRPVNDNTTTEINLGNYRQGKFTRVVSKTQFHDLQEVELDNGDTVWSAIQTIDGNEYSFYLQKSEILGTVDLKEISQAEAEALAKEYDIKVEQTYLEIDGKKYHVNMAVPLHFGNGDKSSLWMQAGLFILGDSALGGAVAAAIKAFGMDAFKDAFKELSSALFKVIWGVLRGIVTGIYRFLSTIVGGIILEVGLSATLEAATEAAGKAWSKSVAKITARRIGYAFAGAVLLVGSLLFLEYVLHRSYQNTYIYNLTDYDISYTLPYKDKGEIANAQNDTIKGKEVKYGPNKTPLGNWYNGSAFRFQSGSDFHGLGYVVKLNFHPKGKTEIVKTFTCMFEIPFSGENSLAATTEEVKDYEAYFKKNDGVNRKTQFSAHDDHHEIIVTYDYLTGKHKDPETGQDLYLYSSLVVIRDKTA